MKGQKFILYTTEPGGRLKVIRADLAEFPVEFSALVATGLLETVRWDLEAYPTEVEKVSYAALVEVQEDWDFILRGPRLKP